MATLKKRRCAWYARVRSWDNKIKKQHEVQIPLKTSSFTIAHERLKQVCKIEEFIKKGMISDYKSYFPWLNDGKSVITQFSFNDAWDEWRAFMVKTDIRPATIDMYKNSMNHLFSFLGNKFPVEAFDEDKIFEFIEYMKDRKLSSRLLYAVR